MSFGKFKEDSKEAEKISSPVVTGVTSFAGTSGRPDAYLGKGTKVVGTLNFTGSAEIDCLVEGEINAKETLTIAEGATVNGKINGAEVVVRGTVNGDIIATKKLSLRRPARIVGNISSANLSIEEGVAFEGKCTMTTGSATSPEAAKTPKL